MYIYIFNKETDAYFNYITVDHVNPLSKVEVKLINLTAIQSALRNNL